MADHLLAEAASVALATVAAVEALLRLPLARHLRRMAEAAGRSLRVLRASRISDHWKERALPAYSRRLLGASAGLFGVIAAMLAAYAATLLAAGAALIDGFEPAPALARGDFALWAVVAACLYLPLRRLVLRHV